MLVSLLKITDAECAFIDCDEAVTYRNLKAQHKKLEHDFITMTKIISLLSTLTKNYQVRRCTW